jgi:hypothetical protein
MQILQHTNHAVHNPYFLWSLQPDRVQQDKTSRQYERSLFLFYPVTRRLGNLGTSRLPPSCLKKKDKKSTALQISAMLFSDIWKTYNASNSESPQPNTAFPVAENRIPPDKLVRCPLCFLRLNCTCKRYAIDAFFRSASNHIRHPCDTSSSISGSHSSPINLSVQTPSL